MAIGTFIGGRYSSTWNSASLGITETGYELTIQPHAEVISESDAWGGSLLDFFYRGITCGVILDSLEYMSGTIGAAFPWGTLGAIGLVGRLGSGLSSSLVLTSTGGTPAASSPASLTGSRAIMSPNSNLGLLFNSKLRKVPIRFDLLPSDSGVPFTTA